MRRFLMPLGVAVLLLVGALKVADWTCESWWFAALGQQQTFESMMAWRFGAFGVFSLIWLLVLGQHMRLAWLYVGQWRERLLLLGPHPQSDSFDLSLLWACRIAVGGGAFIAGLAGANRFDVWMLAWFGRPGGGATSPANADLAFYLFTLPALAWAWNWFGIALVFTAFLVVFVYLATEVIETGPRYVHITQDVANHLAFLGGLIILWVGLKLGLNLLAAPIVSGGTAFNIHGPLEIRFGDTARQFFALSSLAAAIAVWILHRREKSRAAFTTFAIWLGAALTVPTLAPALAYSLGFDFHSEQQQTILNHLTDTRQAWGMNDAQLASLSVAPTALHADAPQELNGSQGEIFNQALWPALGMREELNRRAGDGTTVNQVHLEYDVKGQAIYRAVQQDLSTTRAGVATVIEASATQPGRVQIVSKQLLDDVLIHESSRNDPTAVASVFSIDPPVQNEPPPLWRETINSYNAVARDSFGHCLALAAKFSQPGLLKPGVPVSWQLTPRARVGALMPFVDWNQSAPRPFVHESGTGPRLYYLLDGVIESSSYPDSYSLTDNNGVNYMRQNVVALIDASTGATKFFLLDVDEPFSRVWATAFPQLFAPLADLPADFRAQLRPCEGVLQATSLVASRYHPFRSQNEATTWREQTEDWQNLWSEESNNSPWHSVLANADGQRRRALACAYTNTIPHAPNSTLVAMALVFDRGEAFIARKGRAQWHFYQTSEKKSVVLPNENQASSVEVSQTAFWPYLRHKNVVGLAVVQSTASGPQPSTNPAQPNTDPHDTTQWQLTSKLYSSEASDYDHQSERQNQKIVQTLRTLWDNLRKARQNGNWNEVGRLEKSIGNTLGLSSAKTSRVK